MLVLYRTFPLVKNSRKTSRSRPLNVSVSVSSRTEHQTSRSRLGLGPQGLVYIPGKFNVKLPFKVTYFGVSGKVTMD